MDLRKTHNATYLAIDLGGTFIKSAIMNREGNVYEQSFLKMASHSNGSKEIILSTLENVIKNGLAYCNKEGLVLKGIGLCCPGPFDYLNGMPKMKHKFKNIYGVDLRKFIYEIENVPRSVTVIFMNDANAALQGEMWKGNVEGFRNIAIVTLGTGLGFAFSLNRVVQHNKSLGPAKSIYKLPYETAVLEDYVSERGILKLYQNIAGVKEETEGAIVVGELANLQDEKALATFREAGKILGKSLLKIIEENKIDCLLIGGGVSGSFNYMQGALVNELKGISTLKKISRVYNIHNAPLLGILRSIISVENSSAKTKSQKDFGKKISIEN